MKKTKVAAAIVAVIIVIIIIYFLNRSLDNRPFNTASLGYKQNNPGNIRKRAEISWLGEVPSNNGFEAFKSMDYGYRALCVDLHTKIIKNKLDTVRKVITTYAPPHENHTAKYIEFVSVTAGVSPDQILGLTSFIGGVTEPVVKRIARAISTFETGGYDGQALAKGYNMMLKEKLV